MGDAYSRDLLAQYLRDVVGQFLELVRFLLLLLLFRFVFELAEIEVALCHRLQLLAFELGETGRDPLVDPVVHQQDLDALLAEDLQMRARPGRAEGVGRNVVDLVLAFLHARHVVGERYGLGFRFLAARAEAQELGDALLVREVFGHAFLEHAPELLPDRGVLVFVVLGEIFEERQDALDAAGADRLHRLRLLQDLARDVKRQIVGIDHAAHEAQVRRHELLRVVHDEHALDVELDAVSVIAVPQIERGMRGDVEKQGVLLLPFHVRVGPGERRLEIVADVLVELLVLLFGDLRLGPRPERRSLVDLLVLVLQPLRVLVFIHISFQSLFLHQDRNGDVIGILAQDRAQAESGEELVLGFAQMQDDFGAAAFASHCLQGVLAPAIALPAHPVPGGHPRAPRDERDLVRHDEG